MANQTVYPYGTGGELPASIGLVNDFKTGGVNKAWTAEMGKVTGGQLILSDTFDYDDMTPFSTGKEYKADSSQVGKSLSSVNTYSETGWKNFRIPVAGATQITYRAFQSNYSYGCLFLNENDIVLQGVITTTSDPDGMRTIGIPNGATTFIWSVKEAYFDDESMKIVTVDRWRFDKQDEEIESIDGKIDAIVEDIGEITVPSSSFYLYEHYKDGYQLQADSAQIGKALNNVPTYSSSAHSNVRIPLDGIAKVSFSQYGSNYNYGSLIVDANDNVLMGITSPGGNSVIALNVPSGAAYLIYSYTTSEYDKDVTLYSSNGLVLKIEELEEKEPSVNVTGKSPKLMQGKPNSSGEMESGNYLTTDTIFGDFFIALIDGWKVHEAHIYDRNGKMVSYQYVHPSIGSPINLWDTTTGMLYFSTENTVPEFGIRLVFKKADSSSISDGENPVSNLVVIADSGLHRWCPDDLPNYDIALRRIDYIQHLRWIPLAKVPNGYPGSGTEYGNINYDIAGRLAVGVPYSDVAETRKYVPNYVSLRTFMTAVKNRRSLLYTEELNNNTSKYGMSYKTGHRRAYYGTVCCGFTNWVMGNDVMYLSDAYGQNTLPGLTTVANATANTVRPLDLVWTSGHISIITDIFKDDFGKVKYIVWGEMTTPYPWRTIYTPEQFAARMVSDTGYVVHRWDGWENLQEPEPSEYSQYLLGDVRREPKANEDIMCFAGDYAAFAEGDTIYLNARRNSTYTGIELYKNDALLQTIDISEMSADTIVTPNTDDWVAVNLTTLNLTYGKYKARMTDGTNTTDYTYFEVIDITLSAVKNGSNIVLTIGSNEGVPVGLEKVKENGFPNGASGYHEITSSEVEAGTITLGSGWGYNSTYKYIMMLVKGDYGTVCNKIVIPSA